MNVIIDNHHGSLDDSTRAMRELPRLEAIRMLPAVVDIPSP
jgi:hypothetical protein